MDFFFFGKNLGRSLGKIIRKNLSSKYSQNLLDYVSQSATGALKTPSKRLIQKPAKATGNLVGNKVVEKIIKSQKLRNSIIQKQLQINMISK